MLLLKDGMYCITFTLFPSAAMNIKDYYKKNTPPAVVNGAAYGLAHTLMT